MMLFHKLLVIPLFLAVVPLAKGQWNYQKVLNERMNQIKNVDRENLAKRISGVQWNYQKVLNERMNKMKNVDWEKLAERISELEVIDKFPNQELLDRYSANSASVQTESNMTQCVRSLAEYIIGLALKRGYASQMDYSSGHYPDSAEDLFQTLAFSWGSTFPGYYRQCRSVKVPEGLSFDSTQFCWTSIYDEETTISVNVGKCLPATCSQDQLTFIFNVLQQEEGIFVTLDCEPIPSLTNGAIVAIAVSSLLVFLLIVSTIYDYFVRYNKKKYNHPLEESPEESPVNENVSSPEGIENESFELSNDQNDTNTDTIEAFTEELKEKEGEQIKTDTIDECNGKLKKGSPPPSYQSIAETYVIQPAKQRIKNEKAPYHPGRLGRALLSFSVLSNTTKLLSTNQAGNLGALNGLRVLSMFWVILGHTIFFISGYFIENLKYVYGEIINYFGVQLIWNANFSVDTFFFLSGFLVAYLTLRELHKNRGKLNWFLFYFHRYWRLTPMFAFTILIYLLVPYFVIGPNSFYSHDPGYSYQCREYWWATLLYFGNLYPFPGTMDMCIGWTWYLANDFQLYIISPLFIILLYKQWKIGLPFTLFVMLCSTGVTAGVATYFGVFAGLDDQYYNDNLPYEGAEYVYNKPWTRMPVYLVGTITGWFVLKFEREQLSIQPFLKKIGLPKGTKWLLVFLGWCCSTAIALTCLFGVWSTVNHPEGNALPQWQAVLYLSLSRTAWAVSIAWIAFACISGYGGPINRFLSWKFWIPMGRLTYGAYLIHPIVMYLNYWAWDVQYYFEFYSMICLFLSHIVVAYVSAFFLSLAVESPMIGLEKVLLGKK